MSTKKTGAATPPMRAWGSDESTVEHRNAPLRDLHHNGHDLNHSYKNPVAEVTNIGGVNNSYLHPLSHSGMKEVPAHAFEKANTIKPISEMGTGKT